MAGYSSPRFNPAVLIDNGTLVRNKGMRGHVDRDWKKNPFGSLDFARPYSRTTLDRRGLIERIKEKDANNSWMTDIIRQCKRPVLNQQNTNFCHSNAPTGAVMTKQCLMSGKWEELSAASVGAQVTNYTNTGNWGGNALKQIVKFGITTLKYWPLNYWRTSQYWTPEAKAEALKNQITDWEETEEGNFLQLATLVCADIPCFIGVPNWGHEVEVTQILYNEDKDVFSVYGPNSWGIYNNDGGFYQCTERYIRGFDCYGAVSVDPN